MQRWQLPALVLTYRHTQDQLILYHLSTNLLLQDYLA
jgi:hypothetical protein